MALKERRPSPLSRFVRWLVLRAYKRYGWRAVGEIPEPRRFVIVAAPHTSNWDFPNFLGLAGDLGIRPHFMAKQALFRWPWRRFMLDMGGVPIDRSSANNVVDQMVAEFSRRDEFMLTIAPEGTRGAVSRWRTGFYQIAVAAKVPMVMGMMDYEKKSGGLGPAIMPTGDYQADMKKIMEVYRSVVPRHPGRATKDMIGAENGGGK
ncbi:MAG: lysophospholipid acyltransferase family protein [Sphingorhabdus sp.]